MDDNEILQRIKEDDPKIITQLYKQHSNEFIGYIRKRYPEFGVADAEDIFSDCFQILCGNVKGGKLNSITTTIKAYLYRVGLRLAWDEYYRKDRVKGGAVPEPPVPSDEPDWDAQEKKSLFLVQTVGSLNDPCKTLLKLFWFEEKSDKEIVELTNYPSTDTVKNQRSRCMKTLKKVFLSKLVAEEMITNSDKMRLIGE
jgi:RNA polymerase sigma factor (sigma-70 family)